MSSICAIRRIVECIMPIGAVSLICTEVYSWHHHQGPPDYCKSRNSNFARTLVIAILSIDDFSRWIKKSFAIISDLKYMYIVADQGDSYYGPFLALQLYVHVETIEWSNLKDAECLPYLSQAILFFSFND